MQHIFKRGCKYDFKIILYRNVETVSLYPEVVRLCGPENFITYIAFQ